MSRKKRGTPANDIYSEHIFGANNKYNSNPALQNEFAIQRMLERSMTELAMNRFEWSGIDDDTIGIDPRFLEMCLFYNGLCVVYWEDDYDKLIAVRGTGTGYVNMLDNPVSFTVLGPGSLVKPTTDTAPAQFKNKTLGAYQPIAHSTLSDEDKKRKAIPIWPNYLRYPDIDIVRIYARRLATLDRTIEINSKNARRNKILKSTPNTQLSVVNLNRQIDEGIEAIEVTGALQDMDAIQAIDLGILPESFEKLHILRARTWNEAMGLLGIDSANQDKKERMVAAEVTANDEQADTMKFVNLNARQYACELINSVFGTNISVDYRSNVEKKKEQEALKEVENNGNIHDDTTGRNGDSV